MIREDLLNKELNDYRERRKIDLKPVRFNKDEIFNLFRKYKNWGMTESSYCCYGEERCCWYDPYEEGIWDLSLKQVRDIIMSNVKSLRHVTRSVRKYKHRMYMYKDKDRCYIYIYCRDIYQADYHIWFSNSEE